MRNVRRHDHLETITTTTSRTTGTNTSTRSGAAPTLRRDLLSAALSQPLELLSEQAVGEVLDRVDDDTHEVGTLVRTQLWDALRTIFSVVPMWVVAG
jgi:ATP-binding cassette, subfamily B, bacterial